MAGVQRTRIGYGNEGRTKQLAASLSDFIRLFSLYYPTSPQQHNTTHQISCYARHSGGSSTGTVRLSLSPPPPPFTKRTDSQVLRIHRCISSRSISHLHHSDLYDPTFISELHNVSSYKVYLEILAQFSHFLSR